MTQQPDPGVEANARLTAGTGALLLVLLAAEGVTVLAIHKLLPAHIFIGLVLVPPILLKLASTLYKFARYYSGEPRYRLAGPPQLGLRLLGPLVVLCTIVLFATGIELWLVGFRFGAFWLTLHKLSFVAWFGVMALHVLGHLESTPRLIWRDLAGHPAGRVTRWGLVGAALLLGVVLAVAALPFPSPFVAPTEG